MFGGMALFIAVCSFSSRRVKKEHTESKKSVPASFAPLH
jgi:hypothetical protein